MKRHEPATQLLLALFELARDVEIIDVISVSERCGWSVYTTLKTLNDLGERGLVDVRRLRLTFLGLAAASALAGKAIGDRPSIRPLKVEDGRRPRKAA